MIELEKKILLTDREYGFLLEHFESKSKITHVNFYFDTKDFALNQQNITCRIRFKNGKYRATMKCHTSSEKSFEIELKIRDGLKDNSFLDMGLKYQGSLITKRSILMKEASYEVVLDCNEYLGVTDYELEIEYLPDYEEQACRVFKDILMILHNVTNDSIKENKLNPKSKSQRFFERKMMFQC